MLHAWPEPLQAYAPQVVVLTWLQVPLPLQNDCGWNVVPVQETAAPQDVVVGCCWHAPLWQRPVLPHDPVFVQRPWGSAMLLGAFEHVPAPFRLQTWQGEQLAVEQQTPSVQWSLAHWLLALHPPFGPSFAVQVVPEHQLPLEQSASLLHVVLHVTPLHT